MSTKRKADGSESSNVAISIDKSKADIGPVLATFPSIVPPLASSFDTYRSSVPELKKDVIVVSETEKIEFVGQSNENGNKLLNGCRYMIGVYDKNKNTVTFRTAPVVRIKPIIKSLKNASVVSDRNVGENIRGALNDLGEAFGNKKLKSRIRADERNKISVNDIRGSSSVINSTIEARTSSMPTAMQLKNQLDSDRPVPKYNSETTNPAEIYDMEEVLPGMIAQNINIDNISANMEPVEYNKIVPVRSKFVRFRIKHFAEDENYDADMIRRAVYLSYLIKFTALRAPTLKDRAKLTAALNCHSSVADHILENFTTIVAGSVNSNGSHLRKKTTDNTTKLFCYIAIIMLSLNNWAVLVDEFAYDLSIAVKRAEQYFLNVGCKFDTVDPKRIPVYLSKGSNAGSKKAILKAPVSFPAPRMKRR